MEILSQKLTSLLVQKQTLKRFFTKNFWNLWNKPFFKRLLNERPNAAFKMGGISVATK